MLTFNDYLQRVNDAISGINYPTTPSLLYEPIAYTMSLGGKRIRPILLLMTCDALGGNLDHALPAAIGLEMYHNFTLLHDDVMDRADVRRGQPTVHRRWNDNVAILSGDAMLTLASSYICQAPADKLAQVINLFNTTALEIDEGQQHDMDFERRMNVTQDEYMEMIRLKTSVLLGCAMKMGAIIADAQPQRAQALYDAGVAMGLAFQLQDDFLDVWGDPETFGKEIGGDIVNNKKTFLLINAMAKAQGDDADRLRHWINDEYAIKEEKVPAVRGIYERLGLKTLSQEAIARYATAALKHLEAAQLPRDAHEAFAQLINVLNTRTK